MDGTLRWTRRGLRAAIALVVICGTQLPPSRAELRLSERTYAAGDQPNILIILTDDQRLEGTMMVLPTVRRWFRNGGRRLANAFDTTPLCCPSRATILTGTFAHNHGILTNDADGRTIFD